MCGFKLGPRRIDQAIKHPPNTSLTESRAPSGHPTARPVPAYRLNNFPKRQSIPALGTDPGPCVPELPWVTQTMAQGALQLEIYPTYHVSGAHWAGRHGISVITLVPGRFSPPNVVWDHARTSTDRSSYQAFHCFKFERVYIPLRLSQSRLDYSLLQ